MTQILSNQGKHVLLLCKCFMCNIVKWTKENMIKDTLEMHSNWWIYLYTIELFFFSSFFDDQNITPILNKNHLWSSDENTTWWCSTFWANYRGECEWSVMQERGSNGAYSVQPTCGEQDIVVSMPLQCMCMRLSVQICPDENFCICVWISNYCGAIVLLNE